MTVKENKLIYIFAAIAALGFLFKGVPYAYKQHQQGRMDVVDLKKKKDQVHSLMRRKVFWQQEYDKSITQQNILKQQLFIAKSNELVAAKVQSVIKLLAKQSGVKIESVRLAEFQQSEHWLLVSLSVNVRANTNKIVSFLNKLKTNKQKLLIEKMSVNSNRNILNGTITIVGFSKKKDPQ